MNFVFQCAYLGHGFSGYQSQKAGGGVQDAIRTALQTVFRLKPEDGLAMGCAGRTDAGVHATGQRIHAHIPLQAAVDRGFTIPPFMGGMEDWLRLPREVFNHNQTQHNPSSQPRKPLFGSDNSRTNANLRPDPLIVEKFRHFNRHHSKELNKLCYALNSLLPAEVSLQAPVVYPVNFHTRFSCKGRSYRYLVLNSPYRHALWAGRALWVRQPLDIAAMEKSFPALIGEHDFQAFTRAVYQDERTVRRIDNLTITQLDKEPVLTFTIGGSGFLHNQIRIMMGCFLKVGTGEQPPDYTGRLLTNGRRVDGPATARAEGLYFHSAQYDWPEL